MERFGNTRTSPPKNFLRLLYPVPDEATAVLSEEAWNRYMHRDVSAMNADERAQERERLRLRLALEDIRPRSHSIGLRGQEAIDEVPSGAVRWLMERLRLVETQV